MKRSMAVSLVLLGSTAVDLSSCKPKTETYANVEACEASHKHTEQECRDGYAQAQRAYEQETSQYFLRDECEKVAGTSGCEERHLPGGATMFLPMMLGFALEPGAGYRPLYRYPGSRDCLYTRGGGLYGTCPSGGGSGGGGGGGGGGGYFGNHGSSGSSGDSDGGSARGGFGEAGHGAMGGHGGGGGE